MQIKRMQNITIFQDCDEENIDPNVRLEIHKVSIEGLLP